MNAWLATYGRWFTHVVSVVWHSHASWIALGVIDVYTTLLADLCCENIRHACSINGWDHVLTIMISGVLTISGYTSRHNGHIHALTVDHDASVQTALNH